MMEILTDRVTRYLLRRIRRLAVLDLYQHAAVAGLLDEIAYDAGGSTGPTMISRWSPTVELMHLLSLGDQGKQILARRLGHAGQHADSLAEHWQSQQAPAAAAREARTSSMSSLVSSSACDTELERQAASERKALAVLREQQPLPKAAPVAVALLIARAVGSHPGGWEALRSILRRPDPFIVMRIPVPGFQRHCGRSLEDGLIIPSWMKLDELVRLAGICDYGDRRPGKLRKRIKTIAGSEVHKISDRALSRALSDAVNSEPPPPILLVDQTNQDLPEIIMHAADLVLEADGLDHTLLSELLQICCGIAPKQSLALMREKGLTLDHLHLDDLALIVRPGRSSAEIVSAFEALREDRASDLESGDGEGSDGSGRRKSSGVPEWRSGAKPEEKRKSAGSATVEVIRPQPADAEAVLRVETLSGYGEAADWATSLKLDLDLWRNGLLDWSELSSRLLLSGPPGIGKTTFARALCNTLQVPLLATSVARWLEASYLGDVLKSINAAFTVASEHRPAILFVDEIDNLGSRASGDSRGHKGHDDYWASLINRVLELIDGAAKTEGVIIVAATNLPEKLDPALLRSGRLERHVQIPRPDIDALTGILAHHLGTDLAKVIETAPKSDTFDVTQVDGKLEPDATKSSVEHIPVNAKASGSRRNTV
ncbi:ATP-binding protein [Peteryoungia algae]|uniref:ATP-binding protein n=1 Tax=Peteryoungia algae TaxID=2919917 RepID=A0ABT0CZU2_9HYPH|nr:ATP-binding protein [Rhizobium sp. SSM4.3]MCJ8238685.1 ATP-binding protein [Rhizobium sp. SSM4.3]